MREPAYVAPMDLAEDADGRVAIFSLGDRVPHSAANAEPEGKKRSAGPPSLMTVLLDGPLAAVVLAVTLTIVLVAGLLLLR